MRITNMSAPNPDRTQQDPDVVHVYQHVDCRCHVHDTRSRSKENGRMGKWDLAFDSRRRSGPPSTWFDTGPPLHLPPAMPPPIFHILPLVYVSMIAYPPISLYDMGGVGRPYLISHYARYLTVSQGYSYCTAIPLSVVPLRACVYHVFLSTFLRRLFDPIAAYPRHLHIIREVRRSVAVTVAASPAPPPPLPC
jgi:hypothetical protein